MSTNASITLVEKTGKISSIYLHYDGYPEYAGKILLEHYTDIQKIKSLISLGDLSVLKKYVNPSYGETTIQKSLWNNSFKLYTGHTFNKPQSDVCIAYHRDRGEPLKIFTTNYSIFARNYLKEFEYNYIFYELSNTWEIRCNNIN